MERGDIEWFLRYGEGETAEVAAFLGYEKEKKMPTSNTRGMHHRSMNGDPRYTRMDRTKEIYSWAESMPLEVSQPRKKAIPGPDAKLQHAERMLALNERKLKRFTTICKKWRLRVKYYERKKAAMNQPKSDPYFETWQEKETE